MAASAWAGLKGEETGALQWFCNDLKADLTLDEKTSSHSAVKFRAPCIRLLRSTPKLGDPHHPAGARRPQAASYKGHGFVGARATQDIHVLACAAPVHPCTKE
jgi:hypothetical protein